MKTNKNQIIDTQYVYIKNEQVYFIKNNEEIPVIIDWMPVGT
ncbi:hypothetical protein GGR42_000254 [Saonia flava]|uniref:Uncharacterized protein n=1 Tax=Saonia flava TaxID=523696 RepID=A0A846QTF5_9FLAO|nr:hypothetical protein [Saonia flava]NJB69792.1 hypothetical protein [Saonia flava]